MRIYCMKSCIPIYHGSSDERKEAHCHTIEIVDYIESRSDRFVPFSHVEESLNRCLDHYRGQFLNAFPEFHGDSSIEGIGEALFAQIFEALSERALSLKRLEVSETPLRRYAVGIID